MIDEAIEQQGKTDGQEKDVAERGAHRDDLER